MVRDYVADWHCKSRCGSFGGKRDIKEVAKISERYKCHLVWYRMKAIAMIYDISTNSKVKVEDFLCMMKFSYAI
jgi:hypothetical protein